MSTSVDENRIEQKRPPRRFYSDREKADALAVYDACGSLTEASKACGIPDSTLSQWINGHHGVFSPDIPILRSERQLNSAELAQKFDVIAHLATDHVIARLQDPKRANRTPMPHLMNAAGISVDKSQLIRGLPTSISASVMSEEERQLKLAEVLSRLEAKAIDGQVVADPPVSEMAHSEP